MRAIFLNNSEAGLGEAAALLRRGEVVAVPTETVYGLAANAYDAQACRAIFSIKGRPLLDPLIVHGLDWEHLKEAVNGVPEEAYRLAKRFWPGPLTLVLPKSERILAVVSGGLPSVAVRAPAHPDFRSLLALLPFPLAAPSANPFGYISPTTAEHVARTLGDRIPAILDGGPCAWGLESTIVDLRDPEMPVLLRPGPIPAEDISACLGRPLGVGNTPGREETLVAPGLLESHYSPRVPLLLVEHGNPDPILCPGNGPVARVHWKRPATVTDSHTFWLSENGDDAEAGRELFALLNRLDTQPFGLIVVEAAPRGARLATAINDRLRRASAKRMV